MRPFIILTMVVALFMCASTTTAAGSSIASLVALTHTAGEKFYVTVNTLRSSMTFTPFEYYELPFCRPETIEQHVDSIGQVLYGDKQETGPWVLTMGVDDKCQLLNCRKDDDANLRTNVKKLESFIENEYRAGISVDNLAAYTRDNRMNRMICKNGTAPERWGKFPQKRGFAIGYPKACMGSTIINNHLHFDIEYHNRSATDWVVVGLSVTPYSVRFDDPVDCGETFSLSQIKSSPPYTTADVRAGRKPYWSFSTTWTYSTKTWATRWDGFLQTSEADSDPKVHWRLIFQGLLIALCASVVTGMILMRALHKDFNKYNSEDPDEQALEMGWKLVHADVFRVPPQAAILSSMVGTGVQLLLLTCGTLFFALLGFLSPAARGALLMSMILLFVLLAFVQGYVCSRLLIFFDLKQWKPIFFCALGFPGYVFLTWLLIDIGSTYVGAASSANAKTLAILVGLLLCSTLPLTIFGASTGFRQARFDIKVKVNKLPREIPLQRWYHSAAFVYIMAPFIPLSIVFLELRFILSSLWEGMVYFVFGFLTLVFLMWVIVVVLVTLFVIYYQLTYEDYRWWWRSFLAPGAMGVHVFLYGIVWYMQNLTITTSLGMLTYFGYMLVISIAYGLAAGAIGFIASFLFCNKIYNSIKLD